VRPRSTRYKPQPYRERNLRPLRPSSVAGRGRAGPQGDPRTTLTPRPGDKQARALRCGCLDGRYGLGHESVCGTSVRAMIEVERLRRADWLAAPGTDSLAGLDKGGIPGPHRLVNRAVPAGVPTFLLSQRPHFRRRPMLTTETRMRRPSTPAAHPARPLTHRPPWTMEREKSTGAGVRRSSILRCDPRPPGRKGNSGRKPLSEVHVSTCSRRPPSGARTPGPAASGHPSRSTLRADEAGGIHGLEPPLTGG
jgi:hypothetical protein